MTQTPIQYPIAPHAALPLLADAEAYAACRWDLTIEHEKRAYWLDLFRRHFPRLLVEALRVAEHDGLDAADSKRRADAARDDFVRYLDEQAANPGGGSDHLDILDICWERERVLRRHDFDDPYRLAKQEANEEALEVLPRVLKELDAMDPPHRDRELVRGLFAGNIFDLGATKTSDLFQGGARVDFHDTRHRLKPRPWLVDDLDVWLERFAAAPYERALIFVDNAGPDIALGVVPLARELVKRGTRVLLAANTWPSLNDVTADELDDLLGRIAAFDTPVREALADDRLRVLADGNGAPLIDLTKLDPAFVQAAAAEPVDLVVLQGMGRAVESNFTARFTCDVLKTAMIKDEGVAEALGGEVYDLVLRFEAV